VSRPRFRWPWDQVPLTPDELSAIRAMAAGHPRAFELVCAKLCGERKLSFTVGPGPDGPRATDFAEGKRWIANTLRSIVAMKMPGPKPVVEGPHAVPVGAPPDK
jgi:hypothetical protein